MTTNPESPQAKFEARGQLAQCEACKTNVQWLVEPDRYSLIANNVPDGLDVRLPIKALPVHAAICPNCGNIRLFHDSIPS